MSKTIPKQKARQRQPATHYKLGPKDHPRIMEALGKFVPVYVLAKSIPCDYNTLRNYIKAHPELAQCQRDADDNMVAFAKGKLMQKVSAGHAASIMFLLERMDREHFGRNIQVENIGDLPTIKIGMFKEEEFVEPVDPATMGADAASILENAAKVAHERALAEEAELDAAADAGAAGEAGDGE